MAISILILACLSTISTATPIMTSSRSGLPLKPPQIISRLPKQQLLKFGPINRFTLECRVQVGQTVPFLQKSMNSQCPSYMSKFIGVQILPTKLSAKYIVFEREMILK